MSLPLVIGLLAVALAVAFVLYPFVRLRQSGQVEPVQDELAARRAAIYREVLDLEFDYQMGKLSETDYHELTSSLLRRASTLLAQAEATDQDLDARLEEEIAAARAALAQHRETERVSV